CTAISLAEAEYVALSASYAQVMWMRTQLQDYGFNYHKIQLYYDSQSAIAISCNPVGLGGTVTWGVGGVEWYCSDGEECTVRKALYGLKQALRSWHDELLNFLMSNGFTKGLHCSVISRAEYVALSASCAQVMWMTTQLKDYGFNYNKIPLYCDSQSAIEISCNPVQHSRTKHIHTRYHFIMEQVRNGIIEFYFVRTEHQLGDMFSKALPKDRVILISIHSDEWKSFQSQHQTALRGSYTLSWKPCQGCSSKLKLPDHRYKRRFCSLIPVESDSLPHGHAQTTKTYYWHQDSRIKKAQAHLKTNNFANSDIQDLPLRYQVYQGRLLASFQDDAKYEHVGQDTRSEARFKISTQEFEDHTLEEIDSLKISKFFENMPYCLGFNMKYIVLNLQNMPYCLEEQDKLFRLQINTMYLGSKFDTSYPTGRYAVLGV
nr:ribonuclease H [Tanacetum cinerariifolium]